MGLQFEVNHVENRLNNGLKLYEIVETNKEMSLQNDKIQPSVHIALVVEKLWLLCNSKKGNKGSTLTKRQCSVHHGLQPAEVIVGLAPEPGQSLQILKIEDLL